MSIGRVRVKSILESLGAFGISWRVTFVARWQQPETKEALATMDRDELLVGELELVYFKRPTFSVDDEMALDFP